MKAFMLVLRLKYLNVPLTNDVVSFEQLGPVRQFVWIFHSRPSDSNTIGVKLSGVWYYVFVFWGIGTPSREANGTARQCSPLRRKFIECPIINPALSL